MAAPTFQAVSSSTGHAATTAALTVPWPAHVTGDVGLLFVETAGGSASPSLSTANGFALLGSVLTTGTGTAGTKLAVFWCRATSSSMASPVLAGVADHQFAVMLTFRGCVATGNPWAFLGGNVKASASTSFTVPSIGPAVAGEEYCMVAAIARDNDNASAAFSGWSNGKLGSYAERFDAGTINGGGGGIGIATNSWTGAPADDFSFAVTGTVTSSITAQVHIALKAPVFVLSQSDFRFYEDGTEAGSTAIAAQSTSITRDITNDNNIGLRLQIQETGGADGATTDDYQLQYSKNSSTYYAVGGGASMDYYDASNSDSSTTVGGGGLRIGVGQSFTGDGNPLTTAAFYVSKGSGAVGNMTVEIYAHAGTYGTSSVGTGTALATSNPIAASSLTTSLGLTTFTFSSPYTTTNTTKYVAILKYSDPADVINVGRDASSPSHGGNQILYTTDFGGNWVVGSGIDTIFYINPSPAVTSCDSASLTDGAATTNRLGAGSGSFVAGKVSEDGLVDDLQITANNYTELLYSLTIASANVADADTLDFRVLRNGAVLDTYSVTPRITVSKSVPPTTNTSAFFNFM